MDIDWVVIIAGLVSFSGAVDLGTLIEWMKRNVIYTNSMYDVVFPGLKCLVDLCLICCFCKYAASKDDLYGASWVWVVLFAGVSVVVALIMDHRNEYRRTVDEVKSLRKQISSTNDCKDEKSKKKHHKDHHDRLGVRPQ